MAATAINSLLRLPRNSSTSTTSTEVPCHTNAWLWKLMEAGIGVVPETIRTWCRELGMVRRRRYIKPKQTIRHKNGRLTFVLDQMNSRTAKFTTFENLVHGDENCFYFIYLFLFIYLYFL